MSEDERHSSGGARKMHEYRERDKSTDRSKQSELSSPPTSADELATSIQTSVTEVAIMWILHNWSLTKKQRFEPLDQQIKNFSNEALAVIAAHCPMLRNAKREHLWLIYLKGLLAADTHPREQMIAAMKAIGEQRWIHASGKTTAGPTAKSMDSPAKPVHRDLSDLDALEHISEALAAD